MFQLEKFSPQCLKFVPIKSLTLTPLPQSVKWGAILSFYTTHPPVWNREGRSIHISFFLERKKNFHCNELRSSLINYKDQAEGYKGRGEENHVRHLKPTSGHNHYYYTMAFTLTRLRRCEVSNRSPLQPVVLEQIWDHCRIQWRRRWGGRRKTKWTLSDLLAEERSERRLNSSDPSPG